MTNNPLINQTKKVADGLNFPESKFNLMDIDFIKPDQYKQQAKKKTEKINELLSSMTAKEGSV